MKYKKVKVSEDKSKEEYKIAYDFAVKAYKQFKEVIKTVILFNPTDNTLKEINIIIIVDDCTIDWDQELIAWYREELGKLIAKQKYATKVHVNTVTLSAFWEEVRVGEPFIINVLRYGQAMLDFGGFFEPLKVLLAKGKIRPTPEAVYTALRRAPDSLSKARYNMLASVEGLYWSMVDSAHAALMASNEIPPSPEHIPDMLSTIFVKQGKIHKKYVEWYHELQDLARGISQGKIISVKPEELNEHSKRAEIFVSTMYKITDNLLKREKIVKIEKK
ncbi:MAG: hypothetical protein WC413_00510 [Candidatus Nanoarchaeia archaeon]